MRNGIGELQKSKSLSLLQANLSITKQTVILWILLFFTARANISGILPFGLPACCALFFSEECMRRPMHRILYLLALILGSFSLGRIAEALIVSFAAVLFFVCAAFMTDVTREMRVAAALPSVRLGILLVACIFIPSVIYLAASDASFADFLRLFLQMLVIFASFYLYCHARNGIFLKKRATMLTQEQFASLCIAVVVVMLGLPEVIIAGISTMHILTICVILLVSLAGGFGVGAACGTVAGILMASGDAVYMCMYALGGFLAGLLNRFRRFGAIIGFVIANILLAAVSGGAKQLILGMYETGFAAILFLLLPKKPFKFFEIPLLKGVLNQAAPLSEKQPNAPLLGEDYLPTGLMIGLAADKVSNLARISEEISKNATVLFENSEQKEDLSGEDRVMQIYSRVCGKCNMRLSCWNDHYSETYRYLLQMVVSVEQADETLSEMIRFCPNTEKIRGECQKGSSLFRAERIWRSKNRDCRQAASKQLLGFSTMMQRSREALDEQRKVYYEMRDRVANALEQADITLMDFSCRQSRSGHVEIRLSLPKSSLLPCGAFSEKPSQERGNVCRQCDMASKVLSSLTQKEIYAGNLCEQNGHICTILFQERPLLEASFGVSSAKAHQSRQSGDQFTQFSLEEGSCYAVLSDGIGTGERAAKQSQACLKLIRLFLEGGLNFREAADTVDLLIAASQDGETVSTAVDALYLDLYEGSAHFAKRGATSSYILPAKEPSWREVSIADAPLGFCGGSNSRQENIRVGDVIVMMSDGISDAFSMSSEGDLQVLPRFLAEMDRENDSARVLAAQILKRAVSLSGGKPKDDMTVAVVKIS